MSFLSWHTTSTTFPSLVIIGSLFLQVWQYFSPVIHAPATVAILLSYQTIDYYEYLIIDAFFTAPTRTARQRVRSGRVACDCGHDYINDDHIIITHSCHVGVNVLSIIG